MTRRIIVVFFIAGLVVMAASPALAHPLGNFTINQHVGIEVGRDEVRVDLVVDMAEIPAFREKAAIDADGNDDITDRERRTYSTAACANLIGGLNVATEAQQVVLNNTASSVNFVPGQAGLETLRLECVYAGDVQIDQGTRFTVVNENYAARLGWREIIVATGSAGLETDLPSTSTSAVLTKYPAGPTLNVRRGSFTVNTVASVATDDTASEVPVISRVDVAGPVGALGSLIGGRGLSAGALLLGLGAAFALGVAHALAPGHGKTLMAAYLVGNQGRLRHAIGLGLAVAISHTIGVAALGVATITAAATFRPEAVYPYLSGVSALIVLVVGLVLVRRFIFGRLSRHRHPGGHSHPHGDGHSHEPVEQPGPHVEPRQIGWKSLAALGLSGGLVPSASAVVLLLGAVNLGRVELGVVLVFFFGLGMATALVGAGITVVAATRFGFDRLGDRRWVSNLATSAPVVMAIVITGLGTAMTINAFRGLA